ncbi:atp-Dependent DNA helicase [Arthrobacter sp. Hiyo8]|nr:atp-Dependent DNA helicase [Arthrobacter sp. Hiyo8]
MLADNASLQGEGALLAALNSKRTGRMSDIVGTIQSEQDRIIRSSMSGALVVQGGPVPARRRSRSTAPPTCCTPTVTA